MKAFHKHGSCRNLTNIHILFCNVDRCIKMLKNTHYRSFNHGPWTSKLLSISDSVSFISHYPAEWNARSTMSYLYMAQHRLKNPSIVTKLRAPQTCLCNEFIFVLSSPFQCLTIAKTHAYSLKSHTYVCLIKNMYIWMYK